MFFFDYIYYLLCKFYKWFKDERDLDSWRGSAIVVLAGTIALFCMFLQILFIQIMDYTTVITELLFLSFLAVFFILSLTFTIIRYNKFTNYKEIYFKVEQMSKRKVWILDILALLFILTAFVGTFIAAVVFGPINK